jgi:hypothetical protein
MKEIPMESQEIILREPNFTVGAVLGEAWQKVGGSKGLYWGALSLIMVVAIAFVVAALVAGKGAGTVIQVVGQCIYLVLQVGVALLAIRRIRGENVRAVMVFDPLPKTVWLVLAFILSAILIGIGFVLLILPGIYLCVAYVFTSPLIADRGLGVWQALETSRKAVTKCWFRVFFIYVIMAFINMLGTISLGIGLIWTVPLALNATGILYRELFGKISTP